MCGIQSRLVYRIGPLERTLWVRSSALVCVDRWRGHSHCRAPLTTGVYIYPRVLPSAYCMLVAGPLPLQGALNHWGRILPQGPTIHKNAAEVDIAPAFGEITTACNVGQAKNGSWCLLEEQSMQGFIPTGITAAEICTLILDLT